MSKITKATMAVGVNVNVNVNNERVFALHSKEMRDVAVWACRESVGRTR